MFKVLIRLYWVTMLTFAAAIYLVPELIVSVFHDRFMSYNVDMSRGMQTLLVKQFRARPAEQWPALAKQLDAQFEPLRVNLLAINDPALSPQEQHQLQQGQVAIRLGDWGWRTQVVSPLNPTQAIQLVMPPNPFDMNVLYWSINVLIGAALLGCLLLWLRPHWRDLERLKRTAALIGQGQLSERTNISPRSNIHALASTFDTMAQDIENLLNQQRDLLNAVSHELRTPLTRLDFGLALALCDELPQASRERLQVLVGHIRELDELVLELLSFSRLKNPALVPERVDVGLDEFIDSILGSFDEALETPDIVLDVGLHGTRMHFTLDPRLTARALQNLLRNAMRYCHRRVHVGVAITAQGCEVWVDDDGIGIPEADRERIFEPFYRLDRSRDRTTGGFGLGLAISRRAMEVQGGTLNAEPSPLGGARFRLWLPA